MNTALMRLVYQERISMRYVLETDKWDGSVTYEDIRTYTQRDAKPAYYLQLKQYGGGCDYTIGCGMRFEKLNANTREEALRAFLDTYGSNYHLGAKGEGQLQSAAILLVAQVDKIDLPALNRLRLDSITQEKIANTEAAEKVEYERLKAKFE